ncbi:MAG TPA: prolyl oligopeptidase family serine peptidase [Bryobacteraceae bacterium]|nr:prolyl oligopeptidase family serine peptidase [Bryobacteraceae bacterium]
MGHRLFRVVRVFAFVPALTLSAQDAGLVLRTAVTYRTQRQTLQLSEAQRTQADELARQAQQANQGRQYGEALRAYYHGLAIMRNQEWTPAFELASSLEGSLDHAMLEPGATVKVTLKPYYQTARAAEAHMQASVILMPGGHTAGTSRAVDAATLPLTMTVTVGDAQPGDYTLEVRLSAENAGNAAPFVKSLPVHIEALSAEADRLRTRLARLTKKSSATATAEYALALFEMADRGAVNPHRYKLRDEFAAAHATLDAVEAGRDPFADRHGDMRKAYRSAVDNTLQPYRLFVPQSYDGAKATALLVALHGMGGDENSLFDGYNNGALKREAERVGFMVAAPKGRDSASMYRGAAEQDVMDVIAEVRRDYKIDANRIYLMGHSMGGYGTWSVAMDHPDLFAALGPISGGGDPAGIAKIRQMPEYVVHGDDDRTVNVNESRRMVEAARKDGIDVVYVEVPGGSHISVAAPQFGPMLDFFARQAKGTVSAGAGSDNFAGHYSGQYRGGSSGTFSLKVAPGAGGAWQCEVSFTLSGESVKTTMRQCQADQKKIEAAYDFDAQGFTLRSRITGQWKQQGVEGTYKTSTTDGSADVDQGNWSATRD